MMHLVIGFIASVGLLGTLSFNVPDTQPQCYFSSLLFPLNTKICDEFSGDIEDYRNCSAVLIFSSQSIHFVGWQTEYKEDEPGGIVFPSLQDTSQRDQCLCTLWERFPDYVIWQDGNPCWKDTDSNGFYGCALSPHIVRMTFMPNQPPRRPRPFNPTSPDGLATHRRQQRALRAEGQGQAASVKAAHAQSLATANARSVPVLARDAVEIQAYILRRQGWSYVDICTALEVGQATARTLVEEGAKRCVDEDPVTALRLYLGRIDGLIQAWYPRALPSESADGRDARTGLLIDKGTQQVFAAEDEARARDNGKFVLQILTLQDKIGTWLAGLPRRGQEVKDDDDHAEIKAILLRADEYGPPPGWPGGAPHGMPALDWRPADMEDENA